MRTERSALRPLTLSARRLACWREPPASLAAGLAEESAGVRAAASEALACFHCGLERWIPSIFEVLEPEADLHVRDASLRALIWVRPQTFSAPALSALTAALSSRHREVRCDQADPKQKTKLDTAKPPRFPRRPSRR